MRINKTNCKALAVSLIFMVLVGCQPLTTLPTPSTTPTTHGSQTPTSPTSTVYFPEPNPTLSPTAVKALHDSATLTPSPIPQDTQTPEPQVIRIAVIGDYGSGEQAEQDVADLVLSWNPDSSSPPGIIIIRTVRRKRLMNISVSTTIAISTRIRGHMARAQTRIASFQPWATMIGVRLMRVLIWSTLPSLETNVTMMLI